MKTSIFICLLFFAFTAAGQDREELKKALQSKKDSISKLTENIKTIQTQLDALPGWRIGAFGTIGGNVSGFNHWYSKTAPNSSAGNIGITVNAFAHLINDAFFWRNSTNVNVGWVKLDDKDNPTDREDFETATDVFTLSSLYGRRLSNQWALSALGEYRTTLLDNFNDPGYLDLGLGFTWTPTNNLVVVIHPGNYNFVFSTGATIFESSLGAKVMTDYSTKIGAVNLKSNLSLFQSYKTSNFSNWTWTNSAGYTFWKGIGLGFEFGLRKNKQEALTAALANYLSNVITAQTTPTFSNVANKLQSYWLVGINYNL